ncbi:hypothetical protein D3C79_1096940 [compost metagenome]
MILDHTVERDQVAVKVIQHLHRSRLRAKKIQCRAPGEGFDVAFVRGEERD